MTLKENALMVAARMFIHNNFDLARNAIAVYDIYPPKPGMVII